MARNWTNAFTGTPPDPVISIGRLLQPRYAHHTPARLVGQTAGAIIMTQFFTLTSVEAAPRIGLGIAAVLTLAAGLVSVLRATDAGSVVRSVDCGDH